MLACGQGRISGANAPRGMTPRRYFKMAKSLRTLLVSLLSLMLALTPALALADEAQPGEVIDSLGRVVALPESVERIVSLSPSNTEIIYALGAGDRVVGVDSYSDYPEEAAALESKVGTYTEPNVELIVSLAPDLVFADDNLQQETIDQLAELGVTVVAVTGKAYDDVAAAIELVAQCIGADPAGVLAEMEETYQQAQALVAPGESKSVYYALSFGEYGDWTSGEGTFANDMITMLGATNVGASLGQGWMSISIEKLLEADPDVILIPGDEAMVESFMADESYAELSAVKSGAVYAVDTNMSQRPGPRIAQAPLQFAQILYPEQAASETGEAGTDAGAVEAEPTAAPAA